MKNTTTSEAPDFSVIGGGEKLNKYLLDFIFPVGSYFITHSSAYSTSARVEAHFGGSWEAVSSGYFLEATTAKDVGRTHNAGLPNIKGTFSATRAAGDDTTSGAFSQSELISSAAGTGKYGRTFTFNAHQYNDIYSDDITTVQPKSRLVYVYYRTD